MTNTNLDNILYLWDKREWQEADAVLVKMTDEEIEEGIEKLSAIEESKMTKSLIEELHREAVYRDYRKTGRGQYRIRGEAS